MVKEIVLNMTVASKKYFKVLLPFVVFFVLLIIGEIISPGYISSGNIRHLIILSTTLGIMSIGQTFVILSGKEDLDLSVGAHASLAIVLAALLLQDYSHGVVILVVILIGLGFGVLNGVGVRIGGIPPLIMTFGTSLLLYGVGQACTKGMSVGMRTELLREIAMGDIAGFPICLMIWVGCVIVASYVLHRTIYGRCLYACGSNPEAARMSGISNTIVGTIAYAVSGALSAFAGILLLGRLTIPCGFRMAENYTLPSIAAVVLGGTNFFGGEGGHIGTIGGVIVLITLRTFFSIFNIPEAGRIMMDGAVLLIILTFYARREKLRL